MNFINKHLSVSRIIFSEHVLCLIKSNLYIACRHNSCIFQSNTVLMNTKLITSNLTDGKRMLINSIYKIPGEIFPRLATKGVLINTVKLE